MVTGVFYLLNLTVEIIPGPNQFPHVLLKFLSLWQSTVLLLNLNQLFLKSSSQRVFYTLDCANTNRVTSKYVQIDSLHNGN